MATADRYVSNVRATFAVDLCGDMMKVSGDLKCSPPPRPVTNCSGKNLYKLRSGPCASELVYNCQGYSAAVWECGKMLVANSLDNSSNCGNNLNTLSNAHFSNTHTCTGLG